MKFFLFQLIFINSVLYSSEESEDFRVTDIKGEKIPLYVDIYYNITNKKSGRIWVGNQDLVSPNYRPENYNNWKKFEKIVNLKENSYFLRRANSNSGIKCFLEKTDDNYYIVKSYDENRPFGDIFSESTDERNDEIMQCNDCEGNEDFIQWRFSEMPDYKLNAIMTDLKYVYSLQDIIKNHYKKVDLLQTSTLTNDSPAEISEEISNEVKKTQSFEISVSNSVMKSSKFFNRFSISASIGGKFLGFGPSIDTHTEFSYDLTNDKFNSETETKTVKNEVTYNIKKIVNIPSHQNVQVVSYVNWIENLKMPYKAKITVTGEGPRFEDDHELDSDTIQVLLSKYGFDERLIEQNPKSLTFETKGTFVGSFGLDSVFSVHSLNEDIQKQFYDVFVNQTVAK